MKILFLGLAPTAQIQKWLGELTWEAEHLTKAPARSRKKSPEAVLYFAKSEVTAKDLHRLRSLFPTSWIALILKGNLLERESQQAVLAQSPEIDAFWLKEHWESFLRASSSQIIRHHAVLDEIHELQKQTRGLKGQLDQVTSHSKVLVDQLERDVVLATNIQRSLLPKLPPRVPGIDISAKYLPSLGRGGDYYDVFEFGDKRRFGVLLADSKTHKMAAALLSVLVKLRLEEMKERFPDSKSFVEHLNTELQAIHNKDMASLNLLYGIVDRATLTFQYTVAGNLRPLLWRLGEASPLATVANPPLGGVSQFEFKENILTLKPSDLLLFFTDGIEATLADHHKNAEDRFIEILSAKELAPDPLDIQNEILADIDRYTEHSKLEDDFTLLQLFIHENAMYLASEG